MKRTFFPLLLLFTLLISACAPQAAPSQLAATSPPPAGTVAPTDSAAAGSDCQAGEMGGESPLYNHQVYLTTTQDGQTFEKGRLILEHASVPDLVIGPDGALWVYFVNGEPGHHGIFSAHQTESGDWETLGCVTLDGQFNGNAVDPNIMRLPDGRYRLVYFQGNFVSRTLKEGDSNPIFSAISEDGLHFTVEGELITIPGATDPSLVQLSDGSWLLAVTSGGQTVFARSEDGQTFTEFGQPVQEIGIPELFAFPDGSVGLYLSRFFLSTDGGQTWQEQADVRVPGNGADPSLVALPEGGYAFAYKQVLPGEEGGQPGGQPPAFNPFENLTAEQEACLRAAWGDGAFGEITGFQRPPTQEEEPAMADCGLLPPPGGAPGGMPGDGQGNMPPGGAPGAMPPAGQGGVLTQGNPQDITLNLEISAPYLMAFLACDTAASDCDMPTDHQVYLAQSDDGQHWQIVPGWQPFSGSVPDVIRRGDTLYIYTPGALTRYHLDTGVLEATQPVDIDGVPDGFVDPSLYLDEQGRLTLFFYYGEPDGNLGTCPDGETTCTRYVGSATEEEDSNGMHFIPDDGQRIEVALNTTSDTRKTASDPDIFFDGSRYVLYLSHGLSVSVWTSPELRGEYTLLDALPNGMLTYASGGVPAGYFDPVGGEYWTYVHYAPGPDAPTSIRMARHSDLTHQLSNADFTTIITGESIGLGADWLVASPSFTLNQP